MSLKGKTIWMSGGSRGIGLAIALKAARDGANIVIAAKTEQAHPNLPGTIHSAAAEIEKAGGKALPLKVDIRFEEEVERAVETAVKTFGGIDILVNNASAIQLTSIEQTPIKRFDLMWQINVRGTMVCSKACLPYLRKSENPHILTLSPPPSLNKKWFKAHTPYTISKFAMSFVSMGLAEELRAERISVNALWPKTIIATAALQMIPGVNPEMQCRKPEIVADAAYEIFKRPRGATTGEFLIDEQILRASGVSDFARYLLSPDAKPMTDLFLDEK